MGSPIGNVSVMMVESSLDGSLFIIIVGIINSIADIL